MTTHPTDEELLTSVDPEAFGIFYARHLNGSSAISRAASPTASSQPTWPPRRSRPRSSRAGGSSPGRRRRRAGSTHDEHVWLAFKLDGDHGERFDPTPSRLAPDPGWLAHRQDRSTTSPRGTFPGSEKLQDGMVRAGASPHPAAAAHSRASSA